MPVYNAEKTVGRMVDSIINQTFDDWELIAVDDGSTDGCGMILDDYARLDSRIKVIHKLNGGVASARQTGMDHAQGIYTIHADSDDYVEPDMLEEMLYKATVEDADVVICDYYTDLTGQKSQYIKQQIESTEPTKVLKALYFKNLFGSLWHKLIKKSVYDKAQVCFVNGIDYCEDMLVLTKILAFANPKITYLPKAYYHYVVNSDSLTRHVSLKGLESMRRFHSEAVKLLQSDVEFETIIKTFPLNEFIVFFTNRLYRDSAELKNKYSEIVEIVKTKHYGLRWRMGFWCIDNGFISLAHHLIKL